MELIEMESENLRSNIVWNKISVIVKTSHFELTRDVLLNW